MAATLLPFQSTGDSLCRFCVSPKLLKHLPCPGGMAHQQTLYIRASDLNVALLRLEVRDDHRLPVEVAVSLEGLEEATRLFDFSFLCHCKASFSCDRGADRPLFR